MQRCRVLCSITFLVINMPNKCAAVGCKTKYNSQEGTPSNSVCTLHRFPLKNPNLLRLWLRRLSRENYAPTNNSRLCSRHFQPSDFDTEISDKNKSRRRQFGDRTFKLRKILKPNAVPSVFPELPSYFTSSSSERPTERATTSARRDFLNESFEKMEVDLNETDKVSTIEDIVEKMEGENIPSGFMRHHENGILYLLHINLSSTPPQVNGSIIIHSNMKFEIYGPVKSVPASHY